GGGAANTSLINFNKPANDAGGRIYSNAFGELVQGRIMYDGPHWQSSISIIQGGLLETRRYDHTFQVRAGDGSTHDPTVIVAPRWTHFDPYTKAQLSSPAYSKLPPQMRLKTDQTDPLPPTRDPVNDFGRFYQSSLPCEYLLANNSILED